MPTLLPQNKRDIRAQQSTNQATFIVSLSLHCLRRARCSLGPAPTCACPSMVTSLRLLPLCFYVVPSPTPTYRGWLIQGPLDASLLLSMISYSWMKGGRGFPLTDLVFGQLLGNETDLCWTTEIRKQAGARRERQPETQRFLSRSACTRCNYSNDY